MSKEATPKNQQRKYKRISRLCFGGEFLSVMAPFVTMGLANYREYFVEYDGVKMSLACVIALAVMGVAIFLVSKKKFDNSFITLVVGWAVVDGIFFLMGRIINDIAYIMLFGLIGLLGAMGLDFASKKAGAKAQAYTDGIKAAEQAMIAEAHKAYLEEKKIKVKVKR